MGHVTNINKYVEEEIIWGKYIIKNDLLKKKGRIN